jgi:ubiquinone/menaquinone biosynthesis C-methylase UbiE
MKKYLERKIDYTDSKTISAFEELSLWSSYFGKLLLDNIQLRTDIRLLDVACGTGFPLFELAHRLGANSNLTGIDKWEQAIERAAYKQDVYHLPNVKLLVAGASDMPFIDREFDVVTSNLGYNNFDDPTLVFKECFRVLKPGGTINLTSNIVGHMNKFYRIYEEVFRHSGREKFIPALHSQEQHRGTVKKITEELIQAGFSINNIVEDEFTLRYANSNAFFNHFLTVFGFLEGWRKVIDPEDEEEVFTKLENELDKLAEEEGEIKMQIPMIFVEAQKPGNEFPLR